MLLGTKTFGESSIESLIPLGDGGAIRLTTARFTTPSGREIQGKGLDPDLTVTPLKLAKLAQGEMRHEADLPGALKNPDQPAGTAAGQRAGGRHCNARPDRGSHRSRPPTSVRRATSN